MRNKFAGPCYFCSKKVEVGEGHFEKVRGEKHRWRTIHAACVFEQRKAKEMLFEVVEAIKNGQKLNWKSPRYNVVMDKNQNLWVVDIYNGYTTALTLSDVSSVLNHANFTNSQCREAQA